MLARQSGVPLSASLKTVNGEPQGDSSVEMHELYLFAGVTDELREAWRIFTPLLKQIEEGPGIKPEPYPYGSHGPDSAYAFIQEFYSYHKEARYQWQAKH